MYHLGFAATREIASNAICSGGVTLHLGLCELEGDLDIRQINLQEICAWGKVLNISLNNCTRIYPACQINALSGSKKHYDKPASD